MDFITALQTNDTLTENLMPTHSTSGSFLVDLFFVMGASRNKTPGELINYLVKSFSEEQLLTLKAIFYNRDIRGGQGERRSFRIFFRYLCERHPELAILNFHNVVKFGRWDDILVGLESPVEDQVADFILNSLKNGDKLAAKWMPRDNKRLREAAFILMEHWKLGPKDYRKLLSGNTKVVENLMCKNQWGEVNYNHVPSKAMNLYRKAFSRHDPERFVSWLESLSKPDSGNKIHAEAIFPHDVIKPALDNIGWNFMAKALTPVERKVIEEQWKALPNYLPEDKYFIPVCDVSGSMKGLPIQVSVALGLYLSERNVGPFKDAFITFSERPQLQVLKGDIFERINQLVKSKWDMNTNLEHVFNLILSQARNNNLSPELMPSTILILSDMQFDQCIVNPNLNAYQMISEMYLRFGYNLPNIVFWNLRTSHGVPVKFDQRGTALVSGFSPSIVKNVLGGELDPIKIVHKTLNDERYNSVTL